MVLKWGGTTITAVKWGNTNLTAVYWGNTKVWPDSPLPSLTNYWTGYERTGYESSTTNMAYSANSGNTSNNDINWYATASGTVSLYTKNRIESSDYRYYGRAGVISNIKHNLTGKTKCIINCTFKNNTVVKNNNLSLYISNSNSMSYTNGVGAYKKVAVFEPSNYVVRKNITAKTSNTITWTNSLNGDYYIIFIASVAGIPVYWTVGNDPWGTLTITSISFS